MTVAADWREAIDDVDAAIVDGYQSGFPVQRRPFAAVGEAVGVAESEALERVRRLRERGIFRRFGAVLNPPVVGASTLAALRVPADRFDDVAAVVNGHRQVNHNYRRDHEWNMWFVVTAGDVATRDRVLGAIADETGLEPLVLPMLTDYYIDLEFPVVNADRYARETGAGVGDAVAEPTRVPESAAAELSDLDRRLVLAIQDGFPLTATPYADVADQVDADVDAVLGAVEDLRDRGCIKRVGCVVNHVVTGFDANCMVVWDVPDADRDDRGVAAGSLPSVTLCYHRPRRPERDWPYNLFTMVHGRDADAVDAEVDELASDVLPYDHERLYSTETLKQTGARYDDIVGGA